MHSAFVCIPCAKILKAIKIDYRPFSSERVSYYVLKLSCLAFISGHVAQWLDSRSSNPKTLHGFDPRGTGEAGRGTNAPEMSAHVKDPFSICRERVRELASRTVVRCGKSKTLYRGKKRKRKRKLRLKSAVLWLLTFPGKSNLNFPCVAWRHESYLI